MHWLLGFLVGVGVMAIPAAYQADNPGSINWDAVAAIGTMGAVFVAAMIAVWQAEDRKNERKKEWALRARAIAHRLYPELLALGAQIGATVSALNAFPDSHIVNTKNPNQVAWLRQMQIQMPAVLSGIIDRAHFFDQEFAASIMQMTGCIDVHNQIIDSACKNSIQISIGDMAPAIRRANKLVEAIKKDIAKYHDEPVV